MNRMRRRGVGRDEGEIPVQNLEKKHVLSDFPSKTSVEDPKHSGKSPRGAWFALRAGQEGEFFQGGEKSPGALIREAFLPAGAELWESAECAAFPPGGRRLSAAIVSREPGAVVGAAAGVLCLADGSRKAVVVTCHGGADDALLQAENRLLRGQEGALLAQETLYLTGAEAQVEGGEMAVVEAACLFGTWEV